MYGLKKKLTQEQIAARERALAESAARGAMGNRGEDVAEVDPEDVPRAPGFWITHYYDRSHPENSSAEFIRKKDVLSMSKTHGLGSGMYGVITGSHRGDRPASQNGKVLYQMRNPVVIATDDEFACFHSLSIGLIKACESLVHPSEDPKHTDTILTSLLGEWTGKECSIFLNKIVQAKLPGGEDILRLLRTTVDRWVHDYMTASKDDYLYQPINYFLMGHYDGVYNNCPNGNTFATGSVHFRAEPHIPRAQDSATSFQYALLPGKKLISCTPVDLGMDSGGGKRKKNKRRKSIKKTLVIPFYHWKQSSPIKRRTIRFTARRSISD